MNPTFDLWYIVNSCKMDIDLDNTKHDLRFLKWAIDGFRDMNEAGVLNNTYKTLRLKVNDDNTVDYPKDYESYTKLGFICGDQIINFKANDNISLAPPKVDCNDQIIKEACDCVNTGNFNSNTFSYGYWNTNWQYIPYFHNGQFTAGFYGLGEGFNTAEFREDPENARFKFGHGIHGFKEVVLEYKSTGGLENGNTYIPESAIKCLRSYVHWQRCLFSKDPAEHRDHDLHRRRYQRNIKRVVASINAMTAVEILDIVRSSFHQLPKR